MAAIADKYSRPRFRDPAPSGFIYLGLSIDPPRVPPVHHSGKRDKEVERLRAVAERLGARSDVVQARLFQAVLIPPLKGMPCFDVTMLVETAAPEAIADVRTSAPFQEIDAELVIPADNPVRLGDTENPSTGIYLFNHFLAPDSETAVDGWKSVAGWYTEKAGVDNSIPLRPLEESPYAFINYARIPGNAPSFLLGQLARPSFHSFVRSRLKKHGMTALPLLVRPV
ncbi:hypothetical protein E1281_35130 [Actinomadura sp. KC345]|uniref:hypothetical protein n=1 Tax=Actinomadura sp. KC345 TaxID=2530371 RepID=UPI00104848F6|nr:hypothetical protein [Actinomadura sp. KC345]TDC43533.1 hypothetical protein E1281_35130 [Actinomadura sp. KC345]